MKNKQNIYKNAIEEVNKTLLRFFGISIKKKNGTYQIIKYYDNGYSLGHFPSTSEEKITGSDHYKVTDLTYTICEYAYNGGNYKVRLVEGCSPKGVGDIRVLIEDGDRVWDLYCSSDSKKQVPHTVLSLKRRQAIESNNYVYMETPETYVKPLSEGMLEEVKRSDITGAFYLLGELVLYTTFDGIYIKKYTEEGESYFERCHMDLTRSTLIGALENLILKSNAPSRIKDSASKKAHLDYSNQDVVLMKNFLSSRVDELLSDMKNNKKLYLDRIDTSDDDEYMDKPSKIYLRRMGKKDHFIN